MAGRMEAERTAPESEPGTEEAGKCWTFDAESDGGCKQQSENWAARSTAYAVLLWGTPVALVLVLVWAGACAFFGGRRSRPAPPATS